MTLYKFIIVWAIVFQELLIPVPKAVRAVIEPPAAVIMPQAYLPLVMNAYTTAGDVSLLAAGDIARCGSSGSQKTADLIKKYSGTVLTLGDNVYEDGTLEEYNTCYQSTWGAFKDRTKPIPGNHDYQTANAAGYFAYFGAAAGDPSKGYYSFDLGSWHILAINSNCSMVGGCGLNSPQDNWVRADLAATQAKCVLAYWHHPFYSSGITGDTPQMQPIWQDLYNVRAEIVLSGHEHNYERFAPQGSNAIHDPSRGIVQFVVGTGGDNLAPLIRPLEPNSAAQAENVFGVLHLTLHQDSYSWQYLSVGGVTLDSGTTYCH